MLLIFPAPRRHMPILATLGVLFGITGARLNLRAQETDAPLQHCFKQMSTFIQDNRARFQQGFSARESAEQGLRELSSGCLKTVEMKKVAAADLGKLAALQGAAGDFEQALKTARTFATNASIPSTDRIQGLNSTLSSLNYGGADLVEPDNAKKLKALADDSKLIPLQVNTRILLAHLARKKPAIKGESFTLFEEALTLAINDPDSLNRRRYINAFNRGLQSAERWAKGDGVDNKVDAMRATFDNAYRNDLTYRMARDKDAIVGETMPPIKSEHWLNMPAGTKQVAFGDGKTYLLDFTAHWCGPCRATYPKMEAFVKQYADSGLSVILVTNFFGYFGEAQNLSEQAELDSLKNYFPKYNLSHPVIILPSRAEQTNEIVANSGRSIPEFILIGPDGKIRKRWNGWNPAVEPEIAAVVREGGGYAETQAASQSISQATSKAATAKQTTSK